MWVLEIGCGLDLFYEPFGPEHGGEFRTQDFDGDLALVPKIRGEVDGGHAACADFLLDGVAVGEGGFEPVKGVSHLDRFFYDG